MIIGGLNNFGVGGKNIKLKIRERGLYYEHKSKKDDETCDTENEPNCVTIQKYKAYLSRLIRMKRI